MTIKEMKVQRDQALACALLAACITISVFLSIFGKGEQSDINRAKTFLSDNLQLQQNVESALSNNQKALVEVQMAFDRLDHPLR